MDLRQAQSSTRTCPAGRTMVSFSTPFSNPNKSSPMRLTLLSKCARCANMFTNSTPAFAFRTEPGAALWYWHPTPKNHTNTQKKNPTTKSWICTPWFRLVAGNPPMLWGTKTPKWRNLICRENTFYIPKEFTIGSKSKVWKNEVALKWHHFPAKPQWRSSLKNVVLLVWETNV